MAFHEYSVAEVLTRGLQLFCFVFWCFVLFHWEPGGVHIGSPLPVAVTFWKGAQTLICNLKEQPPKR